MPKIKKRKSVLSVRKKYQYKMGKKMELPECIGTYKKLDSLNEVLGAYQSAPGLNSLTQTDTESVQTKFNVVTKGVQTRDIPDGDHLYALREESGNEIGTNEHELFLYNSTLPVIEKTAMDEKDVYMENKEVVVQTPGFSKFKEDLEHEFCVKNFMLSTSEDRVKLLNLYDHCDTPSVKLSVTIVSDYSCDLFVHRKKVLRTHPVWEGLPVVFDSVHSVYELCERIKQFNVCTGNLEEEYHRLVPVGAGLSSNTSPEILAYREGDFQAKHASGAEYSSTIRSVNCQLLTFRNFKCAHCCQYGYSLKKRVVRLNDRLNSDRMFIHTNFKHRDMTRHELTKKLSEQKEEIKDLHQQVWKLKRGYEKEIS